MFLSVHEQFENLFDQDVVELYNKIGTHLQEIGYTVLGPSITEIIRGEQSVLGKQIDIQNLYSDTIIHILSMYGVIINKVNAYDIWSLFDLLLLINRIEKDENSEDIVSICDSQTNDIETLIALSAYLKDLDWLAILNYVEDLHPLFIERVKEHHSNTTVNHYPIVGKFRDRAMEYLNGPMGSYLVNHKTMFSDLLSFGYDVDSMYTLQANNLSKLDPKTHAVVAYAYALGSNLEDDMVKDKTLEYLTGVLEAMDLYNATSML